MFSWEEKKIDNISTSGIYKEKTEKDNVGYRRQKKKKNPSTTILRPGRRKIILLSGHLLAFPSYFLFLYSVSIHDSKYCT